MMQNATCERRRVRATTSMRDYGQRGVRERPEPTTACRATLLVRLYCGDTGGLAKPSGVMPKLFQCDYDSVQRRGLKPTTGVSSDLLTDATYV
jgi:hypothetical protein